VKRRLGDSRDGAEGHGREKHVHFQGTSLDHIAFDVGGLSAFLKKLDSAAVPYEPVAKIANGARGFTYVTDPGGVYIELMGTLPPAGQ
jgi:catechol 2,3-dioxygenase-like lactoylglutathione lyase family enzyme